MIQIRFNLKDPSSYNATLINLVINYSGRRFKMSTGKSVPPKYWNQKTDRVKENKEFPAYNSINQEISNMQEMAKDAFDFFNDQGIVPQVEELRRKYLEIREQPKKLNNNNAIWDYFDEFIEYQKSRILLKSVMDYDQSLRKHLRATEERFKINLSFNALRSSGNFIDKMLLYLNKYAKNAEGENGFSVNAIGKQMKNIKAFLNWCFMKEYCPPFSLKHIIKSTEDVDKIYLTLDEIDRIYNLPLEDEELNKIRDLFVFGCDSGLRYSDFSRIKREHVGEKWIELYQKKVKTRAKIPINQRMLEILKKYNGVLPNFDLKYLSTFNIKVRELGAKVEIPIK